ncbi:MAG: hypothetical protein NVSMB9_15860 [Isosphaeraceae bacterium]
MSEAPAATIPATETFEALDRTLQSSGPSAVLDLLIQQLDSSGDYRALLDALLLKARYELGLPLIQARSLADLPEDLRGAYEERYVEAIRLVGGKLLREGDIPGAWPYFRAIGETEPMTQALDAYDPQGDDPKLGQVVEVAFNQGAHPRKGFALILRHYGTCSAISAFENLPREEETRTTCADALVRQLHEHLTANLRAEITQRGQPMPPEESSIPALLAGRDWLFADEAYHIDSSHLASVVRLAPLLREPSTLALAAELTDYGCKLSPRHRYEGDPPFEDVYRDHGIYLKALLGQDVDSALAHFQAKVVSPSGSSDSSLDDDPVPAQVLVGLLVRLDRIEDAIDVSARYLAGLPEASLFCPGVSQLCQLAGRPERLAQIAREQGEFVPYIAAVLQANQGLDVVHPAPDPEARVAK